VTGQPRGTVYSLEMSSGLARKFLGGTSVGCKPSLVKVNIIPLLPDLKFVKMVRRVNRPSKPQHSSGLEVIYDTAGHSRYVFQTYDPSL
jgi:hypothetical protein